MPGLTLSGVRYTGLAAAGRRGQPSRQWGTHICAEWQDGGSPGACDGLQLPLAYPCAQGSATLNSKQKYYDRLKRQGRKEKALYFGGFNGTFSLLFEYGTVHFQFAVGPANWETCPDLE